MKIIFSLWTKPIRENKNNALGFRNIQESIESLVLSVNTFNTFYDNIHFYTDSYGLELIQDYLHILPFKEIHLTHDELEWCPSSMWAYPKIYTYSLQDEPFIHADNDVFLWDKILESPYLEGDFLFQSDEVFGYNNSSFFNYYWHVIRDYYQHIPGRVKSLGFYAAVNAGFFGCFTNRGFNLLQEYNSYSIDFINSLRDKPIFLHKYLNAVMEQATLWSLIKEKGYTYNKIMGIEYEIDRDNGEGAPVKFTHTMSHSKKDDRYVNMIKNRIRERNWIKM